MARRPSESELIELIEGDLEPSRLQRRLAKLDETTARRVLEMRADRALLKSLDEPELPYDVFAGLESRLARPMLLETAPGAYRRQHRAPRWPRVVATVAAASIMVGIVLAASLVWANRPQPKRVVQDNDITTPADTPLAIPDAPGSRAPARVVDASPALAPAQPNRRPALGHAAADPATRRPQLAPFSLVLTAADADDAEASLLEATRRLEEDALAVVRNFSPEEAKYLIETYWARRRTTAPPTTVAGVDTPSSPPPASRRPRLPRAASPAPRPGGILSGDAAIAPDHEGQLAIAEEGAAYTITVPARRLGDLLRELRIGQSRQTQLEPDVTTPAEESPRTPVQQWVEDLRVLQPLLETLREQPDTLVHIPVVLRPAK